MARYLTLTVRCTDENGNEHEIWKSQDYCGDYRDLFSVSSYICVMDVDDFSREEVGRGELKDIIQTDKFYYNTVEKAAEKKLNNLIEDAKKLQRLELAEAKCISVEEREACNESMNDLKEQIFGGESLSLPEQYAFYKFVLLNADDAFDKYQEFLNKEQGFELKLDRRTLTICSTIS